MPSYIAQSGDAKMFLKASLTDDLLTHLLTDNYEKEGHFAPYNV